MASKNLGAVIQRAISDGAFRRQLQSDPAAALRGFNLTPDEVAAIRSGDSGRLMSLGVDQRMSKAFTVGAVAMGSTRQATSDLGTGATSNALVGDQTAGTRDGIVAEPNSGSREALSTGNLSGTRAIHDDAPVDTRSATTIGGADGTRAIHDDAPVDTRSATTIGGADGTRALHEDAPADLRSAASIGDVSGTRAVNEVAPFGSTGTSALEDPNAPEFRAATSDGDLSSGTRAIHESAPFEGNVNAAADAGSGDPYSGQYLGVSPDFQARIADDGQSVAARMADAGGADATRGLNDSDPFDSGINTSAPTGDVASGDIQHDPGMVSGGHGDAVVDSTPGPETGNEHSWG